MIPDFSTCLPPPNLLFTCCRNARPGFQPARRGWPWPLILTLVVLVAGVAVRTCHWAAFRGMGFDEALYRNYLRELIRGGLGSYPDIVDGYLAFQKTIPGSILPPTRFLYILCAYGWHGLFGTEPLACFYAVSRVFSIGTLLVAGGFARRLFADRRLALATLRADGIFAPANPPGAARVGGRVFRVLGAADALGAVGKLCNNRGTAGG